MPFELQQRKIANAKAYLAIKNSNGDISKLKLVGDQVGEFKVPAKQETVDVTPIEDGPLG